MNRNQVFGLFLLFIAGAATAQQWQFHQYTQEPTEGYIRYEPEGQQGIQQALSRVPENVTLKYIFLGRVYQVVSDTLQQDLIEYYKREAPGTLEAAFASAGNLHNPALVPLQKNFNTALLATRFIAELNRDIAASGYRITAASHEKFFLIKESDGTYFDAMVWLELERTAATPSPAK